MLRVVIRSPRQWVHTYERGRSIADVDCAFEGAGRNSRSCSTPSRSTPPARAEKEKKGKSIVFFNCSKLSPCSFHVAEPLGKRPCMRKRVIIFDGWAQRKRRKFYFSYQTSMEKNFSLPTQLEKFFWAIYHRACAVFRHSWFSHLHGPSSFFPWSIFPTHPSRSGVAPGEYWSFG